MGILDKYPALAKRYEELCRTRCDEILEKMVETDGEYDRLRQERADTSMALRDTLEDARLFEAYSDAVHKQEGYEHDQIYRQAFLDTLNLVEEQGLT